jgi:V/A-type H+-transporting ATPase subunit I
MPTGGFGRIVVFFGFTIAIGAIINSLGLVINIVNKFKLGHYFEAVFNKIGLCGALFFWYIIFMVIRALLGGGAFYTYDIIFLAIPLGLLVLREPIHHIIYSKRPILHSGIAGFIMEGMIEIMESVSYYISNSLSFVRVAAFALSHTVLSLIVFELGDFLAESSGTIGPILIIILGNLVIITLEGMIVAIQVVRLQYYEFFSKFFTETGEEFKPFSLL